MLGLNFLFGRDEFPVFRAETPELRAEVPVVRAVFPVSSPEYLIGMTGKR